MEKILACPNCGPSLKGQQQRCPRCGHELVYIGLDEVVGHAPLAVTPPVSAERSRTVARPVTRWVTVTGAAVAVLGLAGVIHPWSRAASAIDGGGARMAASLASAGADAQPAGAEGTAAPGAPEAPSPAGTAAAYRPGDPAEALARYQAALERQPDDPVLLGQAGQILVTLNRPADAVPLLERAVAAEPWSVVARFDLAVACARSGRLAEAVDHYAELVRGGSTDARVFHNQALALRQLGRNAEAVGAFERAVALEPERAGAWLGLALSLDTDGRRPEAADALERYLALQPAGPEADNARARLAQLRADPGAPAAAR